VDIAKINDLLIEVSSENTKLHLKNEQLENNWNELKEWLEEEYKYYQKCGNPRIGYAMGQISRTQNKMQEIESGKND